MNNNENSYYKELLTNHHELVNDVVDTYYNKKYNCQVMCYFRIYFLYYLLTSYVYKPELNIKQIKNVFFLWMKETLKNDNKKIHI